MSEKINNYLKGKGYRKTTVRSYSDMINNYLDWLEEERIDPRGSNYNNLLDYIGERRKEGDKKRTIKSRLTAIGHYYDYLAEAWQALEMDDNPVRKIRLKGSDKNSFGHPIKEEGLRGLFENYQGRENDKILVGLLIFQGLRPKEIMNLKKENLQLDEGKIMIYETHRSNEKKLKLEPEQILPLYEDKNIFQGLNGNDFSRITRQLKKMNPKIRNLRHIRSSVIGSWMERFDMRLVQYMAGHKYLGSTQHYGREGLEGLQKLVNELHPLQ